MSGKKNKEKFNRKNCPLFKLEKLYVEKIPIFQFSKYLYGVIGFI